MKFFVSRQVEFPDGDMVVEIAQGGSDYANADMLSPMWASLGEGKEFTDPRAAVEAAINVRDMWKSVRDSVEREGEIHISFGCTMGFTLPLTRMSDDELKSKADTLFDKLPKCAQCGDLLGKETFTHDFAIPGESFCREYCAETNYNNEVNSDEKEYNNE